MLQKLWKVWLARIKKQQFTKTYQPTNKWSELLTYNEIDAGRKELETEEQLLWEEFLEKLEVLQATYGICKNKQMGINIFPQDLRMRYQQIGYALWTMFILLPIRQVIIATRGLALTALAYLLCRLSVPLLEELPLWLYLYCYLPYLILDYFLLIITSIISSYSQKLPKPYQKHLQEKYLLFNPNIQNFLKELDDNHLSLPTSALRSYKLLAPLQPTIYAKKVQKLRQSLAREIDHITNERTERLKSLTKLLNQKVSYNTIKDLSKADQFLLWKALHPTKP